MWKTRDFTRSVCRLRVGSVKQKISVSGAKMYLTSIKLVKRNILSAALVSIVSFAAPVSAQVASSDNLVVQPTEQAQFVTALQAALSNGGHDLDKIAKFYAERSHRPLWADGNPKTMLALITAIERTPDHGMVASRYNLAALEALWMAADSPEGLAALEVAAAQSFVQFAKELTSGVLDPKTIHEEMNATRKLPKTATVLENVAAATDMAAHYKSLQPSSPEYAQMLALKVELEALISSGGWGPIVPTGPTLRPGQSNERVAALRIRLNERGYDLADVTSRAFTDDLDAAVKAFQIDFGLNSDGLVGSQTLASINAQPDVRLKQVVVNLERMRWMNYKLGERHIYVNIPDYRASVMDDGEVTLSFRVVVGTDEHQTAEFSDSMTHIIANPTWHVPYSIASEEYLPELLRDPTVLQRNNIKMLISGSGQEVDSTLIDYSHFTEENFPFDLKQLPSPNNALGLVKFMFPNKYNIYLHDTPSKSLFSKDGRAFSHGCVRVQKPMEFAYTLLSKQEVNSKAVFNGALDTGEETQIDLVSPVPVHIVYRTAWVDNSGEPQYRHDIYGRDVLVFDALVNAGVTLPVLER